MRDHIQRYSERLVRAIALGAGSTVFAKTLIGDALSFPMGAAHTSELQYLFSMGTLNESQRALSDAMVGGWVCFMADSERCSRNGGGARPDALICPSASLLA